MKKKIEYVILVLVFMLSTNSCFEWFLPNDEYYNIKIVNNSSDTIFVHFQGGVDIRELYFEDLWDYSVECVIPDSTLTYPTQKKPNYHNNRFSLIVLKKTTQEKYSIDEIRENRIMDYGVVYSYEELEKMNFIIKYTGQEKNRKTGDSNFRHVK